MLDPEHLKVAVLMPATNNRLGSRYIMKPRLTIVLKLCKRTTVAWNVKEQPCLVPGNFVRHTNVTNHSTISSDSCNVNTATSSY